MEKKNYSYDEAFGESLKYFQGDELAARVWVNKYAVKDSFGNIYEKSPEDMHWRIANEVARIEAKYPNPLSSEELFGLLDHFKYIVKEYRDAYGMFAVNGILFNHESERRGENFVTRKITLAVARIACGLQEKLYLGNMDSLRDWGYAKDYVECMWLMLQQEKPEDFVIATGEQHTVRDFVERAFKRVGKNIIWEGSGIDEKGIDSESGTVIVEVDARWFRPTDVDNLWGDPTKAKTVLGWNPQQTSYEELINIMVDHDMKIAEREMRNK